jgi:hypothetical protein
MTGVLLSKREDRRRERGSIRETCADFTAAIGRMRFRAAQIHLYGPDAELELTTGGAGVLTGCWAGGASVCR